MAKGSTSSSKKSKRSWKTQPKKKKTKSLLFQGPQASKPEQKVLDVTVNAAAFTIGSGFNASGDILNPMTQGVTAQTGIGNKIRMKSVRIRGTVCWVGGQTSNPGEGFPSQVRLVCLYDTRSGGNTTTRTAAFQDGTKINSPQLIANQDRFITVFDELTDMPANGQFNVSFDIYRKMDMFATYSNSNTIPLGGSLCFFYACNSQANDPSATFLPVMDYYSRVKFTDD